MEPVREGEDASEATLLYDAADWVCGWELSQVRSSQGWLGPRWLGPTAHYEYGLASTPCLCTLADLPFLRLRHQPPMPIMQHSGCEAYHVRLTLGGTAGPVKLLVRDSSGPGGESLLLPDALPVELQPGRDIGKDGSTC